MKVLAISIISRARGGGAHFGTLLTTDMHGEAFAEQLRNTLDLAARSAMREGGIGCTTILELRFEEWSIP